VQLLFLYFAAI